MILTLQFYLRKIWKTLKISVLFIYALGEKHSLAPPLIVLGGGGGYDPVGPPGSALEMLSQ